MTITELVEENKQLKEAYLKDTQRLRELNIEILELKEALMKCRPYTTYNSYVEKCNFCNKEYHTEYDDDCEYIKLTESEDK